MSQYLIYGLRDPRTNGIRYVGRSLRGLTRPREHASLGSLKRDRSHKANWIRELLREGLLPELVVLQEYTSEAETIAEETIWIRRLRFEGAQLTNHSDGGEGCGLGYSPSKEARRNLSAALTGKKLSPETIAKRTASRAGWSPSPETRVKMSAATKGKSKPEGFGEKVAAAKRGKKRPLEFCERMSALMMGRNINPEHISALGSSWKGKTRSEETKTKMAEAKRVWWAAKKAAEAAERGEVCPA